MSLLAEIQDAAVDSRVPIADLLRKCNVLAARLKNQELRDWVTRELNGYAPGDALPEYRVLHAPAKGHFAGPFGSGYRNLVIPPSALPKEYRTFAERAYLRQPIATCVALAETDPAGNLSAHWPGDLLAIVGAEIFEGMQCYAAWQELTHAAFAGLIDSVRNRILEFALRLQEEVPTGQELTAAVPPAHRVAELYQTIIVGNVANVATGSPGAVQTVVTVEQGDIDSLRRRLIELGIPSNDVAELETALTQDGGAVIGPKTSTWIAKIVEKASAGVLKVGSGVGIGLIVKAISNYLGIG